MVSVEFADAVKEKNIKRIRIILKNSLLVDKSFEQFEEMLVYVKKYGINVWDSTNSVVEFQAGSITMDRLNYELTLLVDDFSVSRVNGIKKMIRALYPAEKIRPSNNKSNVSGLNSRDCSNGSENSRNTKEPSATSNKGYYDVIDRCSSNIRAIVVQSKGQKWSMDDIKTIIKYSKQMENACNGILKGE